MEGAVEGMWDSAVRMEEASASRSIWVGWDWGGGEEGISSGLGSGSVSE